MVTELLDQLIWVHDQDTRANNRKRPLSTVSAFRSMASPICCCQCTINHCNHIRALDHHLSVLQILTVRIPNSRIYTYRHECNLDVSNCTFEPVPISNIPLCKHWSYKMDIAFRTVRRERYNRVGRRPMSRNRHRFQRFAWQSKASATFRNGDRNASVSVTDAEHRTRLWSKSNFKYF